jgi:nucleotide-binding universal stress UspA family protein
MRRHVEDADSAMAPTETTSRRECLAIGPCRGHPSPVLWVQEVAVVFRRILVAVDGEPIAAHAVDIAAELARQAGAELAFIHVIDPALVNAADTGLQPQMLVASAKEEARKLIADLRKHLSETLAVLEFIQIGSAASEIVSAARDWPADLVVIGSHGRGGLKRALMGSVAEAVMRQAPCPVLVARTRS